MCVSGFASLPLQFAFVYIFNLIIGVGALSLPLAFSDAGYVLGILLLLMLAFMSYVTATFMVEAMATANACYKHQQRKKKTVVEAQIQHPVRNDMDYVECYFAFQDALLLIM